MDPDALTLNRGSESTRLMTLASESLPRRPGPREDLDPSTTLRRVPGAVPSGVGPEPDDRRGKPAIVTPRRNGMRNRHDGIGPLTVEVSPSRSVPKKGQRSRARIARWNKVEARAKACREPRARGTATMRVSERRRSRATGRRRGSSRVLQLQATR